MSNDTVKTWIRVVIFAVAFAYVESAVVVYLRDIFFDGAFRFPLIVEWEGERHLVSPLVRIEFWREIATIFMLIAVAGLAGKKSLQRFCFFMIAFGVWDIFYYVWLYVMTGWPDSLLTWDLLFYVPLPWVGPVITPVLIAAGMVIAGSLVVFYEAKGYAFRWRWTDTMVAFFSALLLIVAFCWDWKNIMQIPGDLRRSGVPELFAWWLFVPAYLLAAGYFAVWFRRMISKRETAALVDSSAV